MNVTCSSTFTKTDTLKAKAIAVILMLFHHLFRKSTFIDTYEISVPSFMGIEALTRLGTDARVCVWIFVFLSAYGISLKLQQNKDGKSVVQMLYKQWWSLMKPYWFVYVALFLLSFTWSKSAYDFYEGNWVRIFMDFFGCSEFVGVDLWMGGWWYMCFAQALLIALPLLLSLVDKMGIFSVPLAYFAIQYIGPGFKSASGGYYSNYLYAVLLAIIFVKYDLFNRFSKKPKGILSILEAVGLLFAFYLFADWKVTIAASEFSSIAMIFSALSVVALCLFVQKYVTISWLEKPLAFIGKHSGNIYLVHLAVYRFYPKVVFCTKTVLGSLAVLLGVSLLISLALEALKKLLHYDQFISSISGKILGLAAAGVSTTETEKTIL